MISGNAPGRHSSEALHPRRMAGGPNGFWQSVGSNDELRDNDVVDFPVQLLTGKEGEAQRAAAKVFEAPDPGYENVRHDDRLYHFDTHDCLSAPAPYLRPDRHLDAMSANCQEVFSTQQGYRGVNASLHWSLRAFALLLFHVAFVLFVIAVLGLLGLVAIPPIEVAA